MGSSPLTRGKLETATQFFEVAGAHPRSRGENLREVAPVIPPLGSSPLTRGKRLGGSDDRLDLGLIPAHAGKTYSWVVCPYQLWAHPRSRGENRLQGHPARPLPWLIPAHAGKTSSVIVMPTRAAAHPRSRGENLAGVGGIIAMWGSSPLTRGKPASPQRRSWCCRLIPAHAGKTVNTMKPTISVPAHPRSRGENSHVPGMRSGAGGSSPLTRGKRLFEVSNLNPLGLIPAHAGKTTPPPEAREPLWAHPRSRGENIVRDRIAPHIGGSSPLTRGKHFLTCAFIAQIGQILESLELCASSESYSLRDAYATDALRDQVRSIGLVPLSSRGAS